MVKIPQEASEVSENWFKEVLKETDKELLEVNVSEFQKETSNEHGMLSCIFRIEANGQKYFLKVMPEVSFAKTIVTQQKMFITEVETYRRLFKDLAEFENKRCKDSKGVDSLIPKVISADYNDDEDKTGFYLLLENLTPKYEMKDFNKGLTVNQVTQSVQSLAHFHAVSYSFKERNNIKDFREKYPFLSKSFDRIFISQDMKAFFDENKNAVLKDVAASPTHKYLLEQLNSVYSDMERLYAKALLLPGVKWKQFLTHGDLKANNMMFNAEDECKVFDWQLTTDGHWSLDLGMLAFISMNPEDTEKHATVFIEAYYEQFRDTLSKFETEIPWENFEEFSKDAKEIGFFLTFIWCSFSYRNMVQIYPEFKRRALYVVQKSIELMPNLE